MHNSDLFNITQIIKDIKNLHNELTAYVTEEKKTQSETAGTMDEAETPFRSAQLHLQVAIDRLERA